MSDEEKKEEGNWINNFVELWSKESNGKRTRNLIIPLAETVTIKLQRKLAGGGFAIEEVTLIPSTNEKGYKSLFINLKEPNKTEKYTPHANLKFVGSIPPKNKGDGKSDF